MEQDGYEYIGTPIVERGVEVGRRYNADEVVELTRKFEDAPGFPRKPDGSIDYDVTVRSTIDEHDRLDMTLGMAREMSRRGSGFVYDDLVDAYNRYLYEHDNGVRKTFQSAVKTLKRDMGEDRPEVDKIQAVLELAALCAWLALVIWRIVR